MIGDSNFRQQTTHLDRMLGRTGTGNVIIHGISALGTFEKSQDAILKELDELAAEPNQDCVVLFNIGLHEFTACKDVANCPERYREHLTTLVTAIQKFPAVLKVWQTTPAAWPKVRKVTFRWAIYIYSYSIRHWMNCNLQKGAANSFSFFVCISSGVIGQLTGPLNPIKQCLWTPIRWSTLTRLHGKLFTINSNSQSWMRSGCR